MEMAKWLVRVMLICGLIAVVAHLLLYLDDRRRRKGLLRLARELGLDYGVADVHLRTRLSNTDTFGEGAASEVSNVIDGTLRGQKVTAFDFKHTVISRLPGRRESQVVQCFSACVHPTLYVFPHLAIDLKALPEDLESVFAFGKTLWPYPTPGVHYDSIYDFFRGTYVKSESEDFKRYVCEPDMIKWLRQNRGWEIHFDGGLIIVTDGFNWGREGFRGALDFMVGFAERLPEDAR
ncbi:MAG TPA: hypothetical protein VMX57_01710 [Planctomycetota bacterium]|nr:hypothetical protein [Planctomycetota bacterium]